MRPALAAGDIVCASLYLGQAEGTLSSLILKDTGEKSVKPLPAVAAARRWPAIRGTLIFVLTGGLALISRTRTRGCCHSEKSPLSEE